MHKFNLVYQPFPEVMQDLASGITGRYGDRYTVIIDSTQPEDRQERTLKHELSHIKLGHFEDDRTKTSQAYLSNMDDIEDEANKYADQMTGEELSYLMTYAISIERLSACPI